MTSYWLKAVAAVSILGMAAMPALASTRLHGRVVDDSTGQPLAARVAVSDLNGKFVEIQGDHSHVRYLDKRWCYVDGVFTLILPASGVNLEIRRGLETLPLTVTITNLESAETVEKTFRLRRWVNMREKGYWQGDIHAHLPVPKEAHLQMRAEDLNALTLLYLPDPDNPIPINACFTGRLDSRSTPGTELYVGHEIQDFQMGHLNLMGLTNLVRGYPEMGGGLEYWRTAPHWDLARAVRQTRDQGGMVVWAHACSLPGRQLPIAAALGWLDAIELLTWNDPTQLPNHWGPWLGSGMSQADFPVMRAVDLYYVLLNAGFRIPIAAGTDKFYEEIPLGSNRTYAQVEDLGSYDLWLKSVRAGRGFISNGPMLEFHAGDLVSGNVTNFSEPRHVEARVTARSILPFTTLEIVWNGTVVGHKTVPPPTDPPPDGVYSMTVAATIEVDRSGWLAARVVDHPDLKNPILPRGLSVFAHTAPVYFLHQGRKVREEASIVYLRKYVQGVLHWLDTRPPFYREEDRANVRRDAERALRFYEAL
ncbi:MAG: CehA/McbA family metallohydrolase [Verrucomicrobiia bacterium]